MSVSENNQQHTTFNSADTFSGFTDHQLRSTMDEFLEEKDVDQPNIWNTATIAGIAMFLVCTVYILHLIGLNVVPDIGGAFVPLTIIGALLVGFVGFGFLVGDRKKVKQTLKKQKAKEQDFFNDAFPSKEEGEDIDLEAELFGGSSSTSNSHSAGRSHGKSKTSTTRKEPGFHQQSFDKYAAGQSKKLYRSRTNKKVAGVCGGLAKYFGISDTLIRVLFVVAFFAGSGASMLLYIALMIALKKEPERPLHDYDF